jgi:hypothetical protein
VAADRVAKCARGFAGNVASDAERRLAEIAERSSAAAKRRIETRGHRGASEVTDLTRHIADHLTHIAADALAKIIQRTGDRFTGLVANSRSAAADDVTDRIQGRAGITADHVADRADRVAGTTVTIMIISIETAHCPLHVGFERGLLPARGLNY